MLPYICPLRYIAEASDVACWFGAARACYTPRITASELNDNCQVFGKDRREGEELFQVIAWLVQRERDAVMMSALTKRHGIGTNSRRFMGWPLAGIQMLLLLRPLCHFC